MNFSEGKLGVGLKRAINFVIQNNTILKNLQYWHAPHFYDIIKTEFIKHRPEVTKASSEGIKKDPFAIRQIFVAFRDITFLSLVAASLITLFAL